MSAGFTSEQGVVLRNGILIIVDCLRVREGEVAFSPEFDDGMQIDSLRPSRRQPTAYRDDRNCVQHFSLRPEAQADQLPVYRIDEPRRFRTKHGSTPCAPKLTLVGCTARSGHCRPALQSAPKAMNFEPRAIASGRRSKTRAPPTGPADAHRERALSAEFIVEVLSRVSGSYPRNLGGPWSVVSIRLRYKRSNTRNLAKRRGQIA